MPRIHTVQKSRTETKCSKCGNIIPVGSKYFYYTPYRGKKKSRCENHYPKRSELTSSAYLQTVLGWSEDGAEEIIGNDLDEMQGRAESLAEEIRSLGEEQSDNRENMPESLQDSPTGELLEQRSDACEAAATDIEGIEYPEIDIEAMEIDGEEYDDEDDFLQACEDKASEIVCEVQGFIDSLDI